MPQGAWKQRLAAHVVSLLPDNNRDAREILDYARLIVDLPMSADKPASECRLTLVSENPPDSEGSG